MTAPPLDTSAAVRWRILAYCGVLIALINFAVPSGALIGVPLIFFLKNKLGLDAGGVARFALAASLPVYFSFALGWLRDRWSPLRLGDRGWLIVCGALASVCYLVLAFIPPTYGELVGGLVLLGVVLLAVLAAQNGLTAVLARRHLMTGQVSAVWTIVSTLPLIAGLAIGGPLSDILEGARGGGAITVIFLIGAALMATTALFGLTKPRSVFAGLEDVARARAAPLADVARLARHRAVWPALLIWTLWWFSPSSLTPLQYYLADRLHGNDALFGWWNALSSIALIPTYWLYGFLAPRVKLARLLVWATVIGVPSALPLLFMATPGQAMIAAVPAGLLSGLAAAAFLDLVIRACPDGLEGTLMMLAASLTTLSQNLGNLLGAELYQHAGGFPACVAGSTAANLAILLVLPFVPRAITATADGVASPVAV